MDARQDGHGWWGLLDDKGRPVPGIELTGFSYQSSSWRKPRWVTGIGQYRFSALVSDMDLPADSFNMQDFRATEAALNTVMLAYSLMSLFRQVLPKAVVVKKGVSKPIQHTLQTLRYKLFAKPAYTTTESRKSILNLVMAMQKRQWMQGLWDQSKQFDLPVKFAANHPP